VILLVGLGDSVEKNGQVRVLQCVAVCCSVLQCVAVCCIVLQCVPVWAIVLENMGRYVCCNV